MDPHALFVPGWGAPATLYEPGLPTGWRALEPPSFGGSLTDYRRWLGLELHRRGRSPLGGHSMGGALAILAAADSPELVERLVLG
jgi:pimeloyl-ACP methyl ester carboxylesterase